MKYDGFALITGASRGLGMAFARALAERHRNLVLVARSAEPLHALANEMLRLNNQVIVELTYSLLPKMLERRQKGIINISSTAGFQPVPFASVYSATKAFLTAFSLALEQELRSAGVAVVTVCPGRLQKKGNDEAGQRARRKWADIYQSPDEVVEDALLVLANGGGLTVPGALNKFSVFAQRLIPRSLVPRLVAKFSKA